MIILMTFPFQKRETELVLWHILGNWSHIASIDAIFSVFDFCMSSLGPNPPMSVYLLAHTI